MKILRGQYSIHNSRALRRDMLRGIQLARWCNACTTPGKRISGQPAEDDGVNAPNAAPHCRVVHGRTGLNDAHEAIVEFPRKSVNGRLQHLQLHCRRDQQERANLTPTSLVEVRMVLNER